MMLATETELKDAYGGDAVATSYVQLRFASELHRLLHDRQVAAVQRVIQKIGPGRVLEIAPGPGRLTREIQASGRVVCLEYNEGMIRQGRRACGQHVTWTRGDGFRLPFAQCFDLVYSFRFIRHFHRADRSRLWSEVRRVLRPGGYLVIDAVNENVSRPLREAHPENYPIYDKLHHVDELRAEMTEAGFEVVALEGVQRHYRWQYLSQVLLGPRANWANRLVIRALERLPARHPLEWIALCRA